MSTTSEDLEQDTLPEPRGVEPGDTIPTRSLGPIPPPYVDPDDWHPGYTSL